MVYANKRLIHKKSSSNNNEKNEREEVNKRKTILIQICDITNLQRPINEWK